jgi:hypothetical protein
MPLCKFNGVAQAARAVVLGTDSQGGRAHGLQFDLLSQLYPIEHEVEDMGRYRHICSGGLSHRTFQLGPGPAGSNRLGDWSVWRGDRWRSEHVLRAMPVIWTVLSITDEYTNPKGRKFSQVVVFDRQ